jgi:hypothetical protein
MVRLPVSEKLPWRSSALGTTTGEARLGARMMRRHSCEKRKKVLLRSSL